MEIIIIGEDCSIWYIQDHYQSFIGIKQREYNVKKI